MAEGSGECNGIGANEPQLLRRPLLLLLQLLLLLLCAVGVAVVVAGKVAAPAAHALSSTHNQK